MAHLERLPGVDLSEVSHFLDHNEPGLAFDDLVGLAHELDELELPVAFWQHLDEAAREMGLYDAALHTPHLTSADFCLRRLATAMPRVVPPGRRR